MSSPRAASDFGGILRARDVMAGPINLPLATPEAFIQEFNETYRRIGLFIDSMGDLNGPDSSTIESDHRG